MTFGSCGNLLTFLAVMRNPAMRTNRNLFIFNLALSDFLLCTVNAPITLYTILRTFWLVVVFVVDGRPLRERVKWLYR